MLLLGSGEKRADTSRLRQIRASGRRGRFEREVILTMLVGVHRETETDRSSSRVLGICKITQMGHGRAGASQRTMAKKVAEEAVVGAVGKKVLTNTDVPADQKGRGELLRSNT